MKKGFTLIEVLFVVVIMSVVAISTSILFTEVIKDNSTDRLSQVYFDVQRAAKLYVDINDSYRTALSEKKYVNISLNELSAKGYMESDVLNPVTKTIFPKNTLVRVYVRNDGDSTGDYISSCIDVTDEETSFCVTEDGKQLPKSSSESLDERCCPNQVGKIKPTYCTFEGELVQGAQYTNGQYTYRYKQELEQNSWNNILEDGWGVTLTDKVSTYPVTTTPCTYINNKPVVSMSYMFINSQTSSIDLSKFNTNKVSDMHGMFYGVEVATLDLSSLDTSNVVSMSAMFYDTVATSLISLGNLDTSSVTDMTNMFRESDILSINLNNLDTSNVITMSCMFYNAKATSIDVSGLDTSKVTDMSWMFSNAQATTLDLSDFNTINLLNTSHMFSGSQATVLNLNGFNTSKVTDMRYMFYNSKAPTLDLSSFDTSGVTNTDGMFASSVTTTGYARTQADADKFNASTNKPAGLNFIVK